MKSAFHLTALVLLIVSTTAAAYEFQAQFVSSQRGWSFPGGAAVAAEGEAVTPSGVHRVTTTLKPEECRFYFRYEDEGQNHISLLENARTIGDQLADALSGIEGAKVESVPVNYGPEKSWYGIFYGDKTELGVSFRVTIELAPEGENRFWQNSETIARVLEGIRRVKAEGGWGRKLTPGYVLYYIESIEPTKAVLYSKVEEEVQALRKSVAEANGIDGSEILCRIEYGDPQPSRISLEEVEVMLPYRVDILLKREMEEED